MKVKNGVLPKDVIPIITISKSGVPASVLVIFVNTQVVF